MPQLRPLPGYLPSKPSLISGGKRPSAGAALQPQSPVLSYPPERGDLLMGKEWGKLELITGGWLERVKEQGEKWEWIP